VKPATCAFPKLQISLLTLLLAAGAAGLFAQAPPKPSHGATLFAANCFSCHGSDATGDTSLGRALGAANLRAPDVQNLSDAALKKVIAGGNGNMPSFGGQLGEADLTQLVTYLREIGRTTYASSRPDGPRCARRHAAHRCGNCALR